MTESPQGKSRPRLLFAPAVSLVLASCIMRQPGGPGTGTPQNEGAAVAGSAAVNLGPIPLPEGLPPSVAVLGPEGALLFAVHGAAEKVSLRTISVSGQPFKDAIEADIRAASGSDWSVQIQADTATSVEKGDVLLATFYVRATKPFEDGTAETQFVFEKGVAPYTKSVAYPLGVGPEWRQVRIRFLAGQHYAPGEAHMIFRLGYEPETLQLGGVTVENFGKKVALAQLPSTQARDRMKPPAAEPPLQPIDGGALAFRVDTGNVIGSISPYIYGINSQKVGATGATVRRMGGNRGSVYNWETNASNAGNDYQHNSDDWSCSNLGYPNCKEPGAQYTDFVAENKTAGVESIVTVPIIDWTTADKNGPVKEAETAPSKRFLKSLPRRPGGPLAKPELGDGVVYQDGLVALFLEKFGKAERGGVKFYSLDNEPALWPTTHPRVHGAPTTYEEMITRTEGTAAMITELDPTATVLGAVAFGWGEYMSLGTAPDAEKYNKEYGNYLEFYLASLKKLEEAHQRRLVHVLDVHWYPELKGRKRITEHDDSRKTVDARVTAPRSLWDPTFKESTWIGDQWGKPVRLIPWLKELVEKRYPGTKLSITEYDFGGGEHVSGGIAQADVLGIFGREGLYLGNYWGNGAGVGALPKYIAAAFALFENFDGKGDRFGDTAVSAVTDDIGKASIYAATDRKMPGRVTLIVLNKDQRANYQASITLSGAACTSAPAFRFDGSSPVVRTVEPASVTNGVLKATLPALSATIFVCEKG
jgi:hypothetical protein